MSKTPRDEECPGTSDSQTKEMAGHATTQPPYHDKKNNNTRADNTQCEAVAENQVLEPHQSNERPLRSVFPPRIKVFVILMTVFSTIFSPFSSFIYLSAMTPIAKSYHRSLGEINLTVTVYQIMQAIAPLFFGNLSDQIGRRPVYAPTFAIYLGANVWLALQHNYVAPTALRALQSTGSSATVAIGSAVVADHCRRERRYLGWRSTFWFLMIAVGVFVVIHLPRRATLWAMDRSLRLLSTPPSHHVSNGAAKDATILELKKLPLGIPVPGVVAAIRIIFEKDVGLLMLFTSLFVMANYAMLVPLQGATGRRYSFNDVQAGLCYIPFAMGSVFGAVTVANGTGVSADRKRGDELRRLPIERARLDLMWPWTMLAFVTTAIWGRVVDSGVNLAAPLVILFLAGMGLSGPISILTILLVDLYSMNAGRVSSSFNLTRAGICCQEMGPEVEGGEVLTVRQRQRLGLAVFID
ncbi:Major facilitator superfamily domain, general substrate transporter [Metarhizium guizhouense ARSEF 977]|uniref:Major facilitator superfamily domain, general substrate transporter n=1 Tax=Metarhizium guizhouense (strain ARSEF 977) TaxID=1276136 RepID=A0A0B4HE86_METGA|nr:Major facilitator superfamily domain, general substrate transporter [Metarhizium guizhouense ARSEF 977]